MNPDEYSGYDGLGLAALVRRGEVSPAELVTAARARIEAIDPSIHALVHHFDEPEVGRREGAFAGVPMLLKDEGELAGRPMTFGSRLLRGYVSEHTHPIFTRLGDAGLTFLGRTNMCELGLLPTTEPAAYPSTRNPWDLERSPGGSSGGSAAAVAAGLVPIAHAADGGGSIRIPASACGLVGLKPTRGRHPQLPSDPPPGFVLSHVITRTVRDTAAVLDAVQGEHAQRWQLASRRGGFGECAARDPGPLRIGLTLSGWFDQAIDPEVREAIEALALRLESMGHRVEEIAVPIDRDAFARAFHVLWAAAAGVFFKVAKENAPLPGWFTRRLSPAAFRQLTAVPEPTRRSDGSWAMLPRVEAFTRRLAADDAAASPSDLWLAGVTLEEAAAQLRTLFATWDLWLTPTLSHLPPRLGSLPLDADDEVLERALFELVGFTPIANGTGIPAISVPAGLSRAGLPIGAHFMAPHGREDRLLAIAGQLERAEPWPGLAPLARA